MFRHCSSSLTGVSSRFLLKTQVPRTRLKCLRTIDGVDFTRFLRALTWEEDRGFQNVQGRHEVFSAFARRAISDLEIPYQFEEDKRILTTGLAHYDSLEVPDRKFLIQTCRELINELNTPPSTHIQPSMEGNPDQIDVTQGPPMEAPDGSLEALSDEEEAEGVIQGTEKWKRFRRKRLTASAFARVLGMFNSDPGMDAHDLWLEKLDLKEPFIGNVMTRWGLKMEKSAREEYCKLTGNSLDRPGIGVLGEHGSENWIAGSPDGLIELKKEGQFHDLSIQAQEVLVPSSCGGLLEIKCPYGGWRGPNHVQPPDQMAAYYMPQVQGLMNIFGRDWCHLFYWTQNHGTKIFLIKRDVMYWDMLYEILAKFWWEHVMPAKLCLERKDESYKDHEPCLETSQLIDESKKLAREAKQVQFDNTGRLI